MYTHCCYVVFDWGRATIKHNITALFSKRERADDNFTKKPQKKLIRYMLNFWGFNTKS